jgi:lipocalin
MEEGSLEIEVMSLQEPNTVYDGFATLERGMDSGRSPSLLPANQAALLVNAQTRPGYVSNRPGWAKKELSGDEFQLGRFQGAAPYISPTGQPFLVASIGGQIIRFDLTSFTVLNLSDSPGDLTNPTNLPQAWFVQAETFLCIQDNSSLPLIYDGASLRRAVPVAFGGEEFPVGNIMEYNNGRLWVALPDRRSFVGGDLAYSVTGSAADVLKSTQNQFLTSGSFALPASAGFITAMKSVANQDSVLGQGPLVVFGQFGSATVNAPFSIDAWQSMDSPIVSLGLLSQGSTGQDACVNINGDLWFRSRDGVRSFMIARRDHGTWVNTPLSHEMERILKRDDQYLIDRVSTVDFDNRLLMTSSPYRATIDGVEYGVAFRGLSVLDFTRVSSMFDRTQPTWEGIWNGLSILQVVTINCYGVDRCFLFVLNDCYQIELWELSRNDQFDNQSDAIQWMLETRALGFADQSEALKQLVRTETWLEKIVGTGTYVIRYRPDGSPLWQDLDSGTICATTGMCTAPGCTAPEAPLPQYRTRKISSGPNDDCEECNEKKFMNGFEYQFQLQFTGAASLRRFRAVATNIPEEVTGGCIGTEDCCEETGCGTNPWEYATPTSCECLLAISTQPITQEVDEGGNLILTVAVTGNVGTLTYQWYLDGVALENGASGDAVIDGATEETLIISNITPDLAGNYTVIVTDDVQDDCTATSNPAVVTVASGCTLAISVQPVTQEVEDGGTLNLTVTVTGGVGTLTYQWYLDDVALVDGASGDATISGATTAALTITDITPELAGDYTVVITDDEYAECTVISEAATVTVTEAVTNTISFAFWMEMLSQPDPAGADILSNYDFELWDDPSGSMQSRIRLTCEAVGGGADTYTFTLTVTEGVLTSTMTSAPISMALRSWHHIAVLYLGDSGTCQLYIDTTFIGGTSGDTVTLTPQPYGYLNMTGAAHSVIDYLDSYVYMQDMTGVWMGHALTEAELIALYNSQAGFNGPPWDSITVPTAWWDFDDADRIDATEAFVDVIAAIELTPGGSIVQLEGLIDYGVVKTGFVRVMETAVIADFAYTG